MDRECVSRREFIRGTGLMMSGAAASSALGLRTFSAESSSKEVTVPQSVLGRTGVQVSRLGIGCAHFGRGHVGPADVRHVLLRALELGVSYLDVAPNYGSDQTGYSEEKMGPTIKSIREKVFLVTKTEEPTYEGTWRLLRQSMRRLETDYFDLVHLHDFGNEERFPDLDLTLGDQGALGALREAKQKGVVRFIGASGHLHPSRFHAAIDTGDIDVFMNAVNFVVQHTYDFEHKVWARAARHNMALVAMKVLGGAGSNSQGFRLPKQHYDMAIRYALSIPGVCVAVIGTETVGELQQAAEAVTQFKPLTEAEAYELSKLGLELAGTEPWKVAYGRPLA